MARLEQTFYLLLDVISQIVSPVFYSTNPLCLMPDCLVSFPCRRVQAICVVTDSLAFFTCLLDLKLCYWALSLSLLLDSEPDCDFPVLWCCNFVF